MKCRIVSDLHLDFDGCEKWRPENLEDSKDEILIIAGDLWVGEASALSHVNEIGESWLEIMGNLFSAVIVVFGNHDFWDADLSNYVEFMKMRVSKFANKNIFVLDNDTVEIDGVAFIGSTLWTDYNHNWSYMATAELSMNDFTFTSFCGRPIRATDIYKQHILSVGYIKNRLEKYTKENVPCVVVTHHAPLMKCADNRFSGNECYASDLSDLILDFKPVAWIHGHVHRTNNFKFDETLIISNPRGYNGHELNSEFDPTFILEI